MNRSFTGPSWPTHRARRRETLTRQQMASRRRQQLRRNGLPIPAPTTEDRT